jgi:CRP-like cAMP-binding protein
MQIITFLCNSLVLSASCNYGMRSEAWDFGLWGRALRFDLSSSSSLGLKLKSLGAQADDLDILLQAVKRRVPVAANASVIREPNDVRQLTVLLTGTTCSYKRNEDGGRSILSFQHAGDFCDLYRFVLPALDREIGVQALTDCTVGGVDYRDMEELLSRPTLALALWRASMLEAAVYRERLTSTGRGTALERVAHLLCEQLARREAIGIHAQRLPFSQIDVADATGLSVVHVNRTIQTLRNLDVLSKCSRHIEVIDGKRLTQLAKFDGFYLKCPDPAPEGMGRAHPLDHAVGTSLR